MKEKILQVLIKHDLAHSDETDEYVVLAEKLTEIYENATVEDLAAFATMYVLGEVCPETKTALTKDFKQL